MLRLDARSLFLIAAVASSSPDAGAQIIRISVSSSGAQANASSDDASVSADGSRVAFSSSASNLVPGDTIGLDVFVRDVLAHTTTCVSVARDGGEANEISYDAHISADGTLVAFMSYAGNLVAHDRNRARDIFVRDLVAGVTERVSVDSSGNESDLGSQFPWISADGRYVVFDSYATNLVAGDTNNAGDVFVHDRVTKTTTRVSVASDGTQANDASSRPRISADGRVVVFESIATNLVPEDASSASDVFLHDLASGITESVTLTPDGRSSNGSSMEGAPSADGRFVAFSSTARDIAGHDSNGGWDVFVRDRVAGTTTRVSVDSDGDQADDSWSGVLSTTWPSISGDGRFIAFHSNAIDLDGAGEHANTDDVFVRESTLGLTLRQSWAADGNVAAARSRWPSITGDGRFIAFLSESPDLVSGDSNGVQDVFLLERRLDPASTTSYGQGWPGTLGVPSLSASALPQLHQSTDLLIGNSYGHWTIALLVAGTEATDLKSGFGGHLLVVPDLALLVTVAPAGTLFPAKVPVDDRLVGQSFFVQTLLLDPGAVEGVAFSPGLELLIGY